MGRSDRGAREGGQGGARRYHSPLSLGAKFGKVGLAAKGIFTTKADSGYDDDRTSRYHFPNQYLDRALQMVGDLAVYYEPRRNGGRSAYIAVVQVDSIIPDRSRSAHSYARVSAYLDFDQPVPFRSSGRLYERRLESSGDTGLSGEFRNAVGLLSDDEFAAILSGQVDRLAILPREIWVIDYKTNRAPPRDATATPPVYVKQMAAYRALLSAIYPGRAVRCFLLWTDGPILTELGTAAKMKADQIAQAKKAAQAKHRGLRFTKLVPPGAS